MRRRGGNHRASAAAKTFTVAVMAAALFAQLLSLSHEMTVRHFRCAEHGELTHIVVLAPAGAFAEVPTRAMNAACRAPEREGGDAHEHCGVAFTVEGSSCTPSAGGAIGTVAPVPAVHPTPALVVAGGRAVVLASAPKTSPPSA
ncbi:MAG TPA: hypothetical protein VGP64_00540 [Polyangia bacterium]